MYDMDYYLILGLNNIERYNEMKPKLIREHYEEQVINIESKLELLEANTTKSKEEKMKTQRELMAYNIQIRKAYEYCIKEWSIALRNEILRVNKKANNKSLSSLEEGKINRGNIAIGTKILPAGMTTRIDDNIKLIAKLYEVQYINKMPDKNIERKYSSNDGFLDKTLGIYEVILSSEDETLGYSYNFCAGGIDTEKLKYDPNYRKCFLQSLENSYMRGEEVKYIGYINKQSDGRYSIVKDDAQRQAAHKAMELIQKSEEKQKGESR